jgi:uncharacterized glyoxalase superfamily protein PhnB
MKLIRQVVVFDAADLEPESAFWAGMFGGRVLPDGDWHNVIDADDRWIMGIQRAPGHVPPVWPDGNPQQVHLDLHVEDAEAACARAIELGARQLHVSGEIGVGEGFAVFADPAGHPFCIGWGQPDEEAVRRYVAQHPAP